MFEKEKVQPSVKARVGAVSFTRGVATSGGSCDGSDSRGEDGVLASMVVSSLLVESKNGEEESGLVRRCVLPKPVRVPCLNLRKR